MQQQSGIKNPKEESLPGPADAGERIDESGTKRFVPDCSGDVKSPLNQKLVEQVVGVIEHDQKVGICIFNLNICAKSVPSGRRY